MAMTMPVEISSGGVGVAPSMAFVLPEEFASQPPPPLADSAVTLERVPQRLVAVLPFAGIVTDAEVARQRVALLAALQADTQVAPLDDMAVSVLQYNAPYTVPWRRRNEVALVVQQVGGSESEGEGATQDAVSSWYDAGVRL